MRIRAALLLLCWRVCGGPIPAPDRLPGVMQSYLAHRIAGATHGPLLVALVSVWLVSTHPNLNAQTSDVGLRIIAVDTEAEALRIRSEIAEGVPFEAAARERSADPSYGAGGYLGRFPLASLRREYRDAIRDLDPGEVSPVTPVDGGFVLLTVVAPDEERWIAARNAGLAAVVRGDYRAAGESFTAAIAAAGQFGPRDPRLAQSLNDMAEVHRARTEFAAARPLYEQALGIIREAFGPKDANVAAVLNNLVLVDLGLEDYDSAESHLREYARAGFERGDREDSDARGADAVLDAFAEMLSFAAFRASLFDLAGESFREVLDRIPLDGSVYVAIGDMLMAAELVDEAEAVMRTAVREFPDSRTLPYSLAQLYREYGRLNQAARLLEETAAMDAYPGLDPSTDREQLNFIQVQLGSLYTDLLQFDDARAAYAEGLETAPGNTALQLGLASLFLLQSNPEPAARLYRQVVASEPQAAAGYAGLAVANFRLGLFPESARAAEVAVRLDPEDRKSHYFQGMALLRSGEAERGRQVLEEYNRRESEALEIRNRTAKMSALNRQAAIALVEARSDEALALFREGIETYPEAPSLQLNLGIAQNMLGRQNEAAETFRDLIDRGAGEHFLVHKNLARSYRQLGDLASSQRHRVLYLQSLYAAIGADTP